MRITDIPGLLYLWKYENLYLAGQPSADSWEAIKNLGIKRVINLRDEAEMDFSEEKELLNNLGIEYIQFPIVINGQLSPENCERLNNLIKDEKDQNQFIHCGSANRVGGWLMTYLVNHCGVSFDDAVDIAQQNGLSNPGFVYQAQQIVEK